MPETLSQNEIDSLLQALSEGNVSVEEIEETKASSRVKDYDFRRPNKFSKDHLRTLEMLHQHYARHLSNFLSGYFRTNVNIELTSVGQIIFDEFIRNIPSNTTLTIFDMHPLNGSAIMEANPNFLFSVIDLMFGGSGLTGEITRELTEIEIQVSKKLMGRIVELLVPTWQDIYEIKTEVRSIETNPRLQQLYNPNEVVALLTFSVALSESNQETLNLCLPYIMLDPVVTKLSMRQQFIRQFTTTHEDDYKKILYWLKQCNIDITAFIGEADITIEEFLQLQVGDVILLDKDINSDIDVMVGQVCKFGAQAGSMGDNLAVQIISLNEREE